MRKRSIPRKASVAARHKLLKIRKKRRLKRKTRGLEKDISRKDLMRKSLLAESRTMKTEPAKEVFGAKESNRLGGAAFEYASDLGVEQAKLEKKLKRKQKQLKALKGKKR